MEIEFSFDGHRRLPDDLQRLSADLFDDMQTLVNNRMQAMDALDPGDEEWTRKVALAALQSIMSTLAWGIQNSAEDGHVEMIASEMARGLQGWAAHTQGKSDGE